MLSMGQGVLGWSSVRLLGGWLGVPVLALVVWAVVAVSPAFALQTHKQLSSIGPVGTPHGFFVAFGGADVHQGSQRLFAIDQFGAPDFSGAVNVFDASGSFVSPQITGQFTPQGFLSSPADVAVDSSGGGSDGTVYVTDTFNNVVDAFDASGALVATFGSGGQLNGSTTPAGSLSSPCGVAVDSDGDVYVADQGNNRIWIFDSAGNYRGRIADSAMSGPCDLAVDSAGSVYAVSSNNRVLKFTDEGSLTYALQSVFYQAPDGESVVDVAVDSTTAGVYVAITAQANEIVELDAFGSVIGRFGRGQVFGVAGLAVDSSTGKIFIPGSGEIAVFGPRVAFPDVTTDSASDVDLDGATLNGTVDPDGATVTDCDFDYGPDASYGSTIPCASDPGAGTDPVPVSAALDGLAPGVYHYRLVASSADGETEGEDRTFVIAGPPTVLHASAKPTSDGVILKARVHPGALDTDYHFEYGPTGSYGTATATRTIPAGNSTVHATARIQALDPDTTYHYRIVATNTAGNDQSDDRTFTTTPTAASGARHYEMVSPPNKGDLDVALRTGLFRNSPNGERAAFMSAGPFPGSVGSSYPISNTYIATRTGEGWRSKAVYPRQERPDSGAGNGGGRYWGFSTDLSAGVLTAAGPRLTEDGFDGGRGALLKTLYRRDFFATENPYRAVSPRGSLDPSTGLTPYFSAASADFSRIVFLTTGDPGLTPDAPSSADGSTMYSYIWTEQGLRYIGYYPDGSVAPEANAWDAAIQPVASWRTISSDGSSVVWTDSTAGSGKDGLYLWRDGAPPLRINRSRLAGPQQNPDTVMQGAAADHSRIFFTARVALTDESSTYEPVNALDENRGSLYMYGQESDALTDLAAPNAAGAGVRGVLGVSEDGERVYFAASGKLAPGAHAGELNLYLWEAGEGVSFLAKLDAGDRTNWAYNNFQQGPRTSRVTPDGGTLLFESSARLTDYDNAGRKQAYLYDAASDSIVCASCRPDGQPPHTDVEVNSTGGAETVTDYLPRNLSDDGRRVFFNSDEALIAADVNGKTDVYEYSDGELRLVSTGTGDAVSRFADATPDGEDVFFLTRERISGWDTDNHLDAYVARREGVAFPEPQPADRCADGSCDERSPGSPPAGPTPGSATFNGPGSRSKGARPARSCAVPARRAKGLRRDARRLSRAARRASGQRQVRLRRQARRVASRADRLERQAKRCRQADRRSAK